MTTADITQLEAKCRLSRRLKFSKATVSGISLPQQLFLLSTCAKLLEICSHERCHKKTVSGDLGGDPTTASAFVGLSSHCRMDIRTYHIIILCSQ
jgi:hypothetical protein